MKSGDFCTRSSTGGLLMKSFFKFNYMLQAAAILIGGLFIAATLILGGQAPGPIGARQIAGDPGNERYLTHVATDKPIYRTGEKLYVRAVVLRANDRSPLTG